jgi:expansin
MVNVKATHPTRQHRGHGRRWLPVSVAAAFFVIVGLIAALAMAPSPKHGSQAGLAAASPRTTANPLISVLPPLASSSTSPHLSTTAQVSPSETKSASHPSTHFSGASQSARTTSLAGLVQPGVTYQGVATEYSAADGNGACLFGPSNDMMIAAMNERDYQNSEACGAHILVHAANGAAVTVLITNECPYPCAPGQLDLSQQAFAKIADPKAGRVPITWQLISPGAAGTISLRYQTGSSQYWCGIQVIGERNPVTRLEVSTGSGWQQLPRTSYNYFISKNGTGCGKAIRITDVYGQQLTTAAMPIEPNVAQPARIQFAQH